MATTSKSVVECMRLNESVNTLSRSRIFIKKGDQAYIYIIMGRLYIIRIVLRWLHLTMRHNRGLESSASNQLSLNREVKKKGRNSMYEGIVYIFVRALKWMTYVSQRHRIILAPLVLLYVT